MYFQEREDDEETKELLKIPGFLDALKRAEQEVAAGKTVSWTKVRRDM